MEGSKIKLPNRKKARIEIIPLIDVIFFLLATFVLFTLSLNALKSIPVDLPVAAPPRPDNAPPPEIMTIQVSGDGAIFLNKELVEMSEIRPRLDHYLTQTDDPRVLIAGDEKARFGFTVAVLDIVREAKITKFSVETRPRATGK